MAFFFRKSVRLGPLRFNLSKRGVGASVGVKGARVGIDADGREYVAGGRYGLYFRERGSHVGAGVVVVAIVLGIVAVLAMILAGCSSMSRAEPIIPAVAPSAAPEVPAPHVPRSDLDRGQAPLATSPACDEQKSLLHLRMLSRAPSLALAHGEACPADSAPGDPRRLSEAAGFLVFASA
jgi:hypothetical protein